MRISTKSKIALDILLIVAAHTAQGYAIAVPLISKRLGISQSYLELIFASLKSAQIIQSHRGPGGGYSLKVGPEMISIKNIVDATEEAAEDQEGAHGQVWADLQAHMQLQMAQISLSQILSQCAIQIEPSMTKALSSRAKRQAPSPMPIAAAQKSTKLLGPNSIFSLGKYLLQQ